MKMGSFPCIVLCVGLFGGCALPAAAHEGHDHAAPAAAALPAARAPRVEATGEHVELVAILHGGQLWVYVDDRYSNAPIPGLRIEVGQGEVAGMAEELTPAVYRYAGEWLQRPGQYPLTFTLHGPGLDELLVAELTIPAAADGPSSAVDFLWEGFAALWPSAQAHEGHTHGALETPTPGPAITPEQPAAEGERLADGSIWLPKPGQRLLTLRTAAATAAQDGQSRELLGEVRADPNHSAQLQAAERSRVVRGDGALPHLGQPVQSGAALLWLEPALTRLERAQQNAQVWQLKKELLLAEQQRARIRDQLRGLTGLANSPASLQSIQYQISTAEWEALQLRIAELESVQVHREPLQAPVDGIVSRMEARLGQVVEPGQTLVEIVNPAHLWLEALDYGTAWGTAWDTAWTGEPIRAVAITADGAKLPLRYLGRGRQLAGQAAPVQFALVDAPAGLAVNQPLRVIVQLPGGGASGIAIARSALDATDRGTARVWVHTAAERFAPKTIAWQALDGQRVLVTQGLTAGERVVTDGVALLDQIR